MMPEVLSTGADVHIALRSFSMCVDVLVPDVAVPETKKKLTLNCVALTVMFWAQTSSSPEITV